MSGRGSEADVVMPAAAAPPPPSFMGRKTRAGSAGSAGSRDGGAVRAPQPAQQALHAQAQAQAQQLLLQPQAEQSAVGSDLFHTVRQSLLLCVEESAEEAAEAAAARWLGAASRLQVSGSTDALNDQVRSVVERYGAVRVETLFSAVQSATVETLPLVTAQLQSRLVRSTGFGERVSASLLGGVGAEPVWVASYGDAAAGGALAAEYCCLAAVCAGGAVTVVAVCLRASCTLSLARSLWSLVRPVPRQEILDTLLLLAQHATVSQCQSTLITHNLVPLVRAVAFPEVPEAPLLVKRVAVRAVDAGMHWLRRFLAWVQSQFNHAPAGANPANNVPLLRDYQV